MFHEFIYEFGCTQVPDVHMNSSYIKLYLTYVIMYDILHIIVYNKSSNVIYDSVIAIMMSRLTPPEGGQPASELHFADDVRSFKVKLVFGQSLSCC